MKTWPVMELCEAQLRDVNQQDILHKGLYRKCNTYKAGGGYDRFPAIYRKRSKCKKRNLGEQFVVQLRGCPLCCPYCYVTPDGVWNSKCRQMTSEELVSDFRSSRCGVFHLMGGAPGLYIDQWTDVIDRLDGDVFHSDLLLIEREYNSTVIRELSGKRNFLCAVSIKGCTAEEFFKNTGTKLDTALFYRNLDRLASSGFPFYFTFTNMGQESIQVFRNSILARYSDKSLLEDSFAIQIVHYNALE